VFAFATFATFGHFGHFGHFDQIEGGNVLKVITRPTALRAVGKNMNYFLKKHIFVFMAICNKMRQLFVVRIMHTYNNTKKAGPGRVYN
jgi:hypothetical protein